MTLYRVFKGLPGILLCGALAACGGPTINETCDELQSYQSIVPSERITVPEGLDPLDEFREMSIPDATTAPRPPGSRCIEAPPSVLPAAR
jgi:hypothetical protein